MYYQSKIDEIIFVSEIVPERSYMFNKDLNTGLSVIWNTGDPAMFMIDNEKLMIGKDCIMFLTEFYNIDHFKFERMNVIQFNRQFYCVETNDELGCRGLLFFGESHIPKIEIGKYRLKQFRDLWQSFLDEMDHYHEFKLEMLRSMLQQFLILCVRTYKKQNSNLPADNISVGLIREYNYLVEKHYKEYSTVGDYAKMLHKSPKTLSNIFRKYTDSTPLQIINNRRILEAKRLLKYSDYNIQEISEQLNFKDVQSFSHFFTARIKESPTAYRSSILSSQEQ